MGKKKNIVYLVITYIGAMVGCFGVLTLVENILMSLSLGGRMATMIVSYWLIAIVPIVIMILSKMSLAEIGFTKEKIGLQILIGIVGGLVIASGYFLVPYFLGFGEFLDSGARYNALWQFVFEFVYLTIAVGAVEEIVFRGVIYRLLMKIFGKEWVAIIVSSVLFGFLHILKGSMIQVFFTTIMGLLFCAVRYKFKRCSMLSLIFMHGTYDFMLMVYTVFLLGNK